MTEAERPRAEPKNSLAGRDIIVKTDLGGTNLAGSADRCTVAVQGQEKLGISAM